MSIPYCPRCNRSETHRNVEVYEAITFTLKTADGEMHFEADSDLCNECLRKMLLDAQKYFPSILDHGKISAKLNWTGFIIAKRVEQKQVENNEAKLPNHAPSPKTPEYEPPVPEVDESENQQYELAHEPEKDVPEPETKESKPKKNGNSKAKRTK